MINIAEDILHAVIEENSKRLIRSMVDHNRVIEELRATQDKHTPGDTACWNAAKERLADIVTSLHAISRAKTFFTRFKADRLRSEGLRPALYRIYR